MQFTISDRLYIYIYQLMNNIVTCNVTTLLHVFLNITESKRTDVVLICTC